MTKLVFYNQSNSGHFRGSAELRCFPKAGNLVFSKAAASELNLAKGDRVQVANDVELGIWVLCKSTKDDSHGFELMQSKTEADKGGGLRFTCKHLILEMLKDLKRPIDDKLLFTIDSEGKPVEGFMTYELIPKLLIKKPSKK